MIELAINRKQLPDKGFIESSVKINVIKYHRIICLLEDFLDKTFSVIQLLKKRVGVGDCGVLT